MLSAFSVPDKRYLRAVFCSRAAECGIPYSRTTKHRLQPRAKRPRGNQEGNQRKNSKGQFGRWGCSSRIVSITAKARTFRGPIAQSIHGSRESTGRGTSHLFLYAQSTLYRLSKSGEVEWNDSPGCDHH